MKNLLYIMMILSAFMISCSEDEIDNLTPSEELTEVAKGTEDGLTVSLMSDQNLFVGYNRVTAVVTDANGDAVSGNVTISPVMQMTEMSHACPLEYMNGQTLQEGKLAFAVVFVMPSGDMGSWTVTVAVDGKEVSVPVSVSQPEMAKLVSFVSGADNTSRYFIAMIAPSAPEVGQNDLELAIYRRESMMSWPAVENLTLEMEPWMPSMDHGSPNNVAPVHVSDGHYMGKVNFTMTGDWRINLKVMEGEMVHGEPYFDLLFQ